MIKKSGSAHWTGNLKEGKGTLSTQSGVLSNQPYGFNTRFQDGKGTNPEELIGAAHAACFSMALSNILFEAGITADSIDTTATVSLDTSDGDINIRAVKLDCTVKADADEDKIRDCAEKAKTGCPVSKLLKAEITMDLKIG